MIAHHQHMGGGIAFHRAPGKFISVHYCSRKKKNLVFETAFFYFEFVVKYNHLKIGTDEWSSTRFW